VQAVRNEVLFTNAGKPFLDHLLLKRTALLDDILGPHDLITTTKIRAMVELIDELTTKNGIKNASNSRP
jgi:hypothetical protein